MICLLKLAKMSVLICRASKMRLRKHIHEMEEQIPELSAQVFDMIDLTDMSEMPIFGSRNGCELRVSGKLSDPVEHEYEATSLMQTLPQCSLIRTVL